MTSLRLRLPATSANLGPGFDALGLALSLYLDIQASEASEFSIRATGRNAELCSVLENNLLLTTYVDVLGQRGAAVRPLHLELQNQIPLGMGCGSSAAALLAGVLLANHFGELGLSDDQILAEACAREGHPDNVAACWLGGMTSSLMQASNVSAITCGKDLKWRFAVVLPGTSLATEKARALLPPVYSRADAVKNVQATALLVGAFALDRPDLLRVAMQDCIHQPYRMEACPLLPLLLPLSGAPGVHGVALSGAGPSVLLILDPSLPTEPIFTEIQRKVPFEVEIVEAHVSDGAQSFLAGVQPRIGY